MKNKLVVITGASSGIGKELAITFSQHGYALLLLARRVNLLEELNLPNSMCRALDVRDYASFQKFVSEAEAKYGPTQCLINNAGIMPLDKIYNLDLDVQNDMVDINIKGVLNGMKTVMNQMKAAQTGTIINISSVAGRWTGENRAVYNGTKFAVHAISEQTRRELAPFNVRVLTVAPGLVDTDLISTTTNSEVIKNYGVWKENLAGGLSAKEVAEVIYYAFTLPQNVALKEIVIAATKQPI
ncbi:oxidoreductase [Spiroplasma clarkii]|uniref:Oxidoreductase n=1 Tax=Spiroplasma clarkii TaxID=2139 RepID=A0A1Y0L200_9MOLU|nr:SDR family oxidoreductase [Spiroplasma clarkii]ARU92007.1 oxidoreductase [Spiroplasma clarkii]ATX71340.1 oxidoreductase [Spiroplasma clarkii]